MNNHRRTLYQGAVTIGLLLGAFAISALADWSAPIDTPATCASGNPGCDAPINVANTMQIKSGGLTLNNSANPLLVGLLIANGTVGIQTAAPDTTMGLDVENSPIKAGGGLIVETRTAAQGDPSSPQTGRMWLDIP